MSPGRLSGHVSISARAMPAGRRNSSHKGMKKSAWKQADFQIERIGASETVSVRFTRGRIPKFRFAYFFFLQSRIAPIAAPKQIPTGIC